QSLHMPAEQFGRGPADDAAPALVDRLPDPTIRVESDLDANLVATGGIAGHTDGVRDRKVSPVCRWFGAWQDMVFVKAFQFIPVRHWPSRQATIHARITS